MVLSVGRAIRKPFSASPSIPSSTYWGAHDFRPDAQIPPNAAIFVDANVFIYHFTPDPKLGPTCQQLFHRLTNHQDISAYTSTHILGEVAHQLMIMEATTRLGWPLAGITGRLQKHPTEVQILTRFRQAIDDIPRLGVEVLSIERHVMPLAASLSQLHGLLTNDAVTLACMQDQGIIHLASHDDDFDRVPGITRYAPA